MTHLEAIELIKEYGIKNKSRIYVKTETVARSGMNRTVSIHIPYKDRCEDLHIMNISHLVAEATGKKLDKNGNIKLSGCGMDMHWYIVDKLAKSMGLNMLEKVTM